MLMTGLERLVDVAGEVQRVALSATVRPLETVARYVGGVDAGGQPRPVGVIESNAEKQIELAVRFPEAARVAAENGDKIWEPLSDSFKDVIDANRSTLFFTNSRRMAEKITLKLNDDAVAPLAYAHHGSLAREIRTEVERRLKDGELRAIVATNSLEMGIDIGDLDQVVLVQSPPSVASALQRVGRAGHRVGDTSRGLLFPTHAHDFLEAAVVSNAMAARDIEPLRPMENALDALVQVIVSSVASETWNADELYALVRRAAPYAELPREQFDLVVEMLAGRYAGVRVRDLQPRIVLDRVQNTLKARKGAVFALYNAGGTIPDRGYFQLRHADSGAAIGELDEEFVWEATVGQTFTLGTQNWRIHRITHNDVLVKTAQPTATAPPFWRAENINRSFHFAHRIGEFLPDVADERLATRRQDEVLEHLRNHLGFDEASAEELIDFLERQREVTERELPHHRHLLVEHVRSGPGGYSGPDREQQVVLHTSWGGSVNRPIALALEAAWRERFDGEAEIHADNYAIAIQIKDDVDPGIFLSLVTPANFEGLLRRSLEGSGFFGARFRECAGRALLLTRQRFNQRMPLWLTRLQAKKLMTAVSKLDDFPVLLETWRTCLRDEFDMPAAAQVLADLESGTITWSLTTVSMPSPFASAITFNQIGRYMYADDTPERRSRTALSDDLIRRAVHDDNLRPRLDVAVVGEFEAKMQRIAAGYAPRDTEELSEWVKERVLIPSAEFAVLLEAADLEPPAAVRPFSHGGRSWFVHAENLAHLERTLLEAPVPAETGDVRDAPQLFAEFARFYGPLTMRQWEERFPLEGNLLAEVLAALLDEDAFVAGPLIAGDEAERFCDAENLEILIRFQRAANRPHFEPRPVAALPDFLAAWHRVGAEASEKSSTRRGGPSARIRRAHFLLVGGGLARTALGLRAGSVDGRVREPRRDVARRGAGTRHLRLRGRDRHADRRQGGRAGPGSPFRRPRGALYVRAAAGCGRTGLRDLQRTVLGRGLGGTHRGGRPGAAADRSGTQVSPGAKPRRRAAPRPGTRPARRRRVARQLVSGSPGRGTRGRAVPAGSRQGPLPRTARPLRHRVPRTRQSRRRCVPVGRGVSRATRDGTRRRGASRPLLRGLVRAPVRATRGTAPTRTARHDPRHLSRRGDGPHRPNRGSASTGMVCPNGVRAITWVSMPARSHSWRRTKANGCTSRWSQTTPHWTRCLANSSRSPSRTGAGSSRRSTASPPRRVPISPPLSATCDWFETIAASTWSGRCDPACDEASPYRRGDAARLGDGPRAGRNGRGRDGHRGFRGHPRPRGRHRRR